MKKFIILSAVIISSIGFQQAFADDEVKLKRGCVKDYPLVAGESDQALLGIYAQVCDKKNKDNKAALLVQAAQRYQQLGQNLKALQLVSELEGQNVPSTTLTDVKFLAGLSIADTALTTMRGTESRYLNENDTYPAAKKFTEAAKAATPSSVLVERQEVKPVVSTPRQTYTPKTVRKTRPVVNNRKPTSTVKSPTKSPVKNTAKPAGGQTPFDGFKKK